MKIAELRNGLGDLQRMLSSFGVGKQAKELESLIVALAEFDDLTVPELVKRIKEISAARKAATPKPLDEEAIESGLEQLNAHSYQADDFEKVVNEVLSDKRLKKGEMVELARRFGGADPTKTTKAGVAAFLKDRRLEMRRQSGLGSTIDRMLGRTGS
jgi:hypothetical protein